MTLLHICSDFCNTKLYFNLVAALDKKGIKQIIYVPLKKYTKCKNKTDLEINAKQLKNVSLIFSSILTKDMRLRYYTKINIMTKDIESKIDMKMINVVHAHFLYSNGGVAYKIKKKYNIPYITAIRNTDVNIFYKYFIHCRFYAKRILKASNNIIFISPSYRSFLKKKAFSTNFKELTGKTKVIPNGIDDFWLDNPVRKLKKSIRDTLKFIFIGELSENKNIHNTIGFLNNLKKQTNIKIEYTIIGKESDFTNKILELVKQYDWVSYLGPIYNKQELKNAINDSNIFIMLSKKETFGLVYAEAMSQGLPIMYTKNQGIDGFFPEKEVGVSIDITKLDSEFLKISSIIDSYEVMSNNARQKSKCFNWTEISEQYFTLYKKIVESNKIKL